MTLAGQMYLDNASDSIKKRKEEIKKNIAEALNQIKESMACGDNHCTLLMEWEYLPGDWVALPETIDYLRMNGFDVAEFGGKYSGGRHAEVTWTRAMLEAEQEYENNNVS